MTPAELSIGSLFAGIGGLELGLEWAGLGPVRWQVEIDPFCRRVLAKHWPDARRFEDVRSVGATVLERVDVICGGFPCQDVSGASRGRGAGLDGPRSGLWREFARVVAETHPTLVIVENVGGAALRRWLPTVRRDLFLFGYRTRAIRIDARDVGAPHARARIFVVGHADAHSQSASPVDAQVAWLPPLAGVGGNWRGPKPGALRMVDGLPSGMDRVRALGNAVVPWCGAVAGRVALQMLEAP